jgi:hypothetical protein
MTSMADSLGALPTGPAASTTEFGDDVDGRPLGARLASPTAATTEFRDNIDGSPLGGTVSGFGSVHH